MKKAIIFGAGSFGRRVFSSQKAEKDILCFSDNNPKLWGRAVDGVEVIAPSEISGMDFDEVIIGSLPGFNAIYRQLEEECHVPEDKIAEMPARMFIEARIVFVESLARLVDSRGGVCECGVYQGEFAREINRVFSDRKLYLFDTFSGFAGADIQAERDMGYSESGAGLFSDTSVDAVRAKLPNPEMCEFKKGCFPDTFDIGDETFVFVNLDMDLYRPTKAALKIFSPRMAHGGVILVHDYFDNGYRGVKAAVDEFCEESGEIAIPIGDGLSVAIAKNSGGRRMLP
jgi:hypothetical protein